ncbi:ferredoxin [Gordonia polyisoprenivorans]|uniref:ferredoxin n=1 Tax=Gordonia polyisoprenivorans TaxID=84595 RepID=UPI00223430A7|nr:ferredoxin [Gordonia polyisoprenivorans]
MRIVLDGAKCTSLGNCEAVAPDYFEVGEDGELEILREDVPDDQLDLLKQAVAACPTGALSLVEDE